MRDKVWLIDAFIISRGRTLAHLAEVFADAVKHHDGIVERIAYDGQDSGEHCQVELDLEQ